LLQRLARIASVQPRALPGPGQYLYTASRSLTASDTALPGHVYCQVVFQEYRQNWIAANGEGLFRETDAPPALRAALYRAAAGLPGVKSLGTVTDKLGRHGLALAFDSDGTRHELIFSATTSALLSEQDVLVGQVRGVHAARGTVLGWSTYSAGRVVDRLPAASPLALTPPCVRGRGTVRSVSGRPQDSVIVGSSARPQPLSPQPLSPSR